MTRAIAIAVQVRGGALGCVDLPAVSAREERVADAVTVALRHGTRCGGAGAVVGREPIFEVADLGGWRGAVLEFELGDLRRWACDDGGEGGQDGDLVLLVEVSGD